MHSDLVNILNTEHQMYSRWTVWYLMEIQLCTSEYSPVIQESSLTHWWKPVSPHNRPNKPLLIQSKGNWFTKLSLRRRIIAFLESERHTVWHLQDYTVSPYWRNRNMSAMGAAHHFPLGVLIPQLHHLQWRKFLLPVSVFAAGCYRFASVMLHKFLKNSPWLLSTSCNLFLLFNTNSDMLE